MAGVEPEETGLSPEEIVVCVGHSLDMVTVHQGTATEAPMSGTEPLLW